MTEGGSSTDGMGIVMVKKPGLLKDVSVPTTPITLIFNRSILLAYQELPILGQRLCLSYSGCVSIAYCSSSGVMVSGSPEPYSPPPFFSGS